MSERERLPGSELEHALGELGTRLAYPAAPLAPRVAARLRAEGPPPQQHQGRLARWPAQPGRLWRRGLAAIVVLAALIAGALAAAPGARTALADWLRLHGITIFYSPSLPKRVAPVGTHLLLGDRVSLATAQRRAGYRIVVPTASWLGLPDEVYVARPAHGGQVALVYRARPGLPAIGHTAVGLLLTEIPGDPSVERFFFAKMVEPGVHMRIVSVAGAQGYWLSGRPHLFYYTRPDGMVVPESVRLATNTLLWPHAGLTMRLESSLSESAARSLAATVR